MSRDRAALALLGLVLVFAMVAPVVVPEREGLDRDAAALRLLPPLATVSYLERAEGGRVLVGERWRVEGGEVLYASGAGERRAPLEEFSLNAEGQPRSEVRRFWLGTDKLGRDLLPRVLAGARLSILVALLGVAGAAALAALLGVLAGYAGAPVSTLVDALTDALLSLPRIVLLMVLAFLFDPGPLGLGLLFALTGWPAMTRLVRAEVRQRARGDVAMAGRAAGASALRVAFRHVLPFALATLGVAAGLRVGPYVLLEASLSFLGFGVDPPAASWGHVIAEGSRLLLEAWWVATLPGVGLLLLVLLVNRSVDALQGRLLRAGERR